MAGAPILSLVLLSTSGIWPTDADIADRAAEAFAAGVRQRDEPEQARAHFKEAATLYGELYRRGVHNALLDRNLARAQLLAGELPSAILTLHRGLRLTPQDRDLESTLEAARSQVLYREDNPLGRPIPPSSWWRLGPREWLLGAAVAWLLAWVALTRWWMMRGVWLLAGSALALVVAVVLSVLGVMAARDEAEVAARQLVVIAAPDGTLLRKGPGWRVEGREPAFPPRYPTPLPRGVEARLLNERGDWLRIELAGGEVGWVEAAAVLRDDL
jgi:hypothetical protein